MAGQFVCNFTDTVADTKYGKLRGHKKNGTYIFQGVHYAEADRFRMPHEIEPWEGVKDALGFGFVCPPLSKDTPSNELLVPHRYWPMDEHCQNLNIWTQHLDANAKKPVLVWFHGGGFSAGSAIEQMAYEGENLSRKGDVVVVSVNHRLNILGYLDLSPFGEKYKNSANAGTADMVAALQWIHDNIASFGGDPDNVTIFGQSGGGGKVTALMQTPAADGLFHKGIVQSGVAGGMFGKPKGDGKIIVSAMLKELGLEESEVEKLETLSYDRLAEAYNAVSGAIRATGQYTGCNPMPDDYYLGDPFDIGFRDHAKTIPLMVGTVFAEFSFGPSIEGRMSMTEEQKLQKLTEKFGENTEELLKVFRETYPEKNIIDLTVYDGIFRKPSSDYILQKAAHTQAPTYSYLFDLDFPMDEGRPAWHCSEIPFVFANTEFFPIGWIEGVTERLEEQMSEAWLQFARTGDPNHAALPAWAASTPEDEATMVFGEKCEVRHNFDHKLLTAYRDLAPAFQRGKVKAEH